VNKNGAAAVLPVVKNWKMLGLAGSAAAVLALGSSCTTTYDAYGRPVQSVDPGLAVAGIAAAGLLGYALAEGDDDHDHGHRHHGHRGHGHHDGHYDGWGYGHGYYGY
jgi:hypothetical protein